MPLSEIDALVTTLPDDVISVEIDRFPRRKWRRTGWFFRRPRVYFVYGVRELARTSCILAVDASFSEAKLIKERADLELLKRREDALAPEEREELERRLSASRAKLRAQP